MIESGTRPSHRDSSRRERGEPRDRGWKPAAFVLLTSVLVAVPLACRSEPDTGDAGKGAAGGTAGGGPHAGCPEDGFPSTGCLPSQEGDVCGWGDGYGAICPCDMSCGGIICECTGDYWNCSYWDDWGVPCGGAGGTGGPAGNGGGFGGGGGA